ncbi:transmembrane protease serine 9-like [Lethenteron reissneri]|uniref:transmembrane protease serine 9-like n=1 Tax=Lethenteron reissneri TaxID=7753 RepID=UPI002AB6AAE1|nr:transmembrane protease serine 9-like [Lethenteron reissneri]
MGTRLWRCWGLWGLLVAMVVAQSHALQIATAAFNATSGSISSADFVSNTSAVSFTFAISTRAPYVLKVTFESINLSDESPCYNESLEVLDGEPRSSGSGGGETLAVLCGTGRGSVPPHSLKSTGQSLTLVLNSTGPLEGRGFKLKYFYDAATRSTKSCGKAMSGFPNPWLVDLTYNGAAACSATVISSQWLLTCAHCISNAPNVSLWQARLRDGSTVSVSRLVAHGRFNGSSLDYDAALVQLSATLNFSGGSVQPACLPEQLHSNIAPGKACSLLYNATGVQIAYNMEQKVCNSSSVYGRAMTTRMICTREDVCSGHDGTPLMCKDVDGRWYLTGLSSWGSCPTHPDVFTRVWKLRRFISETAI